MNIAILLSFLISTSIWVSIDAYKHRQEIKKTGRVEYPITWFFGCLFLWPIFFPYYLIRRRKYKEFRSKTTESVLASEIKMCPRCGEHYEDNHLFCSKCGYKIKREIAETKVRAFKETETAEKNMGKKQKLIGLIGSIMLIIGVFMPIVSFPIIGSMNYFQNGEGDGVFILILAILSLFFIFVKKYVLLWTTGLTSLGLIVYSIIDFQRTMSKFRLEMERELADNPFKGLGELAMQSIQLQWGWVLLIIGAILLIVAAAIKESLNKKEIENPS